MLSFGRERRTMNEQIEKIKQLVRIEDYARYLGFHVKKIGRYYTLEEHDSVIINPATNRFFRNSSMEEYAKGSVINFAMYFGQKEYKEAVADLKDFIGCENLKGVPLARPAVVSSDTREKMLLLPPHGGSRKHAYAYLSKTRHIDTFIIDYFFASNRLYEDDKKNCVFVSYDEKSGKPDFACRRGTMSDISFKGDVSGSSYKYCFRIPSREGNKLYVCEAVIDLMSLMCCLSHQKGKREMAAYHFQALSSTQKYMAIFHYLELHPEIEEVYLALDNDQAGRDAVAKIIETGKEKNYKQRFIPYFPFSEGMDWNDVLAEGRH